MNNQSLFVKLLFMLTLVLVVDKTWCDSWTPYRGPTKKPPLFTVYDLLNNPDGEVVGGQYIRRCRVCDMPRLFLALRK